MAEIAFRVVWISAMIGSSFIFGLRQKFFRRANHRTRESMLATDGTNALRDLVVGDVLEVPRSEKVHSVGRRNTDM